MILLVDLIIVASVIYLAAGSIADLRTGEIPEEISYGFIITALTVAAVNSFIENNYLFLIESFSVGLGFFLVGFLLFYLGQWGGGDVKLVSGVGCTLGFLHAAGYIRDGLLFPYYTAYFINLIYIALPYATVYGLLLSVKNRETIKQFIRHLSDKKTVFAFILSFTPSLLAAYVGLVSLSLFYLLIPVLLLAAFFLKAVELTALRENVAVEKLRIGDVVAEDLLVNGKIVASRRDIEGFDEKTLIEVKKLASEGKIPPTIKIKKGIKFAPVLFFALLSVYWVGNFMESALMLLVGS